MVRTALGDVTAQFCAKFTIFTCEGENEQQYLVILQDHTLLGAHGGSVAPVPVVTRTDVSAAIPCHHAAG